MPDYLLTVHVAFSAHDDAAARESCGGAPAIDALLDNAGGWVNSGVTGSRAKLQRLFKTKAPRLLAQVTRNREREP